MTGPKDTLKSLRAARSVPDRLERAETALRELAADKDRHAALIEHLSVAFNDRVAHLEAQVVALQDDLVSRRAFEAAVPLEPGRVVIVVVGSEGAVERLSEVAAVVTPETEYVAVLRTGDRIGAGWPQIAAQALDEHPDAVAAYGERIDILDDGTLVSRFERTFDPAALEQSACIDLSSVVLRREHLADVTGSASGDVTGDAAGDATGDATGWDLVRALARIGTLLPVPVTASVGSPSP